MNSTDIGFRLAFETEEGLLTTEHAFFNAEAADTAVEKLNVVRFAKGRRGYTHLVRFEGKTPVEVKPLDEVAV